jgi:hypothetical protein
LVIHSFFRYLFKNAGYAVRRDFGHAQIEPIRFRETLPQGFLCANGGRALEHLLPEIPQF